jgi:MSHA biogenesis protein MshM
VLLIDEAQALPASTLETVRLLTNLETERRKLLQVVLFGQPELDQRLALPEFPSAQPAHHLFLPAAAARPQRMLSDYIDHRLDAGRSNRRPVHRLRPHRPFARASRGVPRLINILADKALLSAYGRGQHRPAGSTSAGRSPIPTRLAIDLWWPRLQPAARVAGIQPSRRRRVLALEVAARSRIMSLINDVLKDLEQRRRQACAPS